MAMLDQAAPPRNGSPVRHAEEPVAPARVAVAVPTPAAVAHKADAASAVPASVDPTPEVNKAEEVAERARASAVNFFIGWLIFSISISIGANTIHSWLTAPEGKQVLAAVVAAVPPLLLLGATHSLAMMIKTRRRYRAIDGIVLALVLVLALVVAACAFVLCFYAVTDFVTMLGTDPDVAWLWAIGVDVSIVISTLALLVISLPYVAEEPRARTFTPAHWPESPAVRALYLDALAAAVREQNLTVPSIAELEVKQVKQILTRLADPTDSVRAIGRDMDGLHRRNILTIEESAQQLMQVTPLPTNDLERSTSV